MAAPNRGFFSKLQALEKSVHGKCTFDSQEYLRHTLIEMGFKETKVEKYVKKYSSFEEVVSAILVDEDSE